MHTLLPIKKIRAITFPPPPVVPETSDGPDPKIARMHLNEASGLPSPQALATAYAAMAAVNRYPDHGCTMLAEVISARTGIATDRISFGNGSGEILVALAMLSINEGDNAVMPAPTFPTCGKGVQIAGGTITHVPLRADGVNDIDAMLTAITAKTRLFYLCTPNNPTGGIISTDDLSKAARIVPDTCLLVVDEAYYEFAEAEGGPNVLSILKQRSAPWVVTRSFSKAYCMAGLRLGYALSNDAALQDGLWQLRPNFNINRIALAAGTAAMLDEAWLSQTLKKTIEQRQHLKAGLIALGFEIFPSYANFLTVRPPADAAELATNLANQNILVQALTWPDSKGTLRITVGSDDNINRLLRAVSDILAARL